MLKEYGSGHFGEWITDENGLPAYRYTCNQYKDPAAVTPTNPVWRSETDHSFQFGNARITCVASNNGTVQVRQDEGAPKLLGDIDPAEYTYGGGLGWLSENGVVKLSTIYTGDEEDNNIRFERIYGTGYIRKKAAQGELSVDQLIFAPFGDDPVLISQVTIENSGETERNVKWFEYWSAKPYPLSYRTLLLSLGKKTENLEVLINNSAAVMRRELSEKYEHRYSRDGNTLFEKKTFAGFGLIEKGVWSVVQKKYRPLAEKAHNASLYVGELDDMEDVNPPSTFLSAQDAPVEGFLTNGKAFFGKGGAALPDGISHYQFTKMKMSDTAMVAVSPVVLAPGARVTLTYVYGYVPEGFTEEELLNRYSKDFGELFSASCREWKLNRISLSIPEKKWIDRELLWHHQSLSAAATYDSAFQEHILSQGHLYQYIMGFQGAARDPLQHVMPFIFTKPELVREVIRYTLKEVLPDGEIPYGIAGHGSIMLSPILSSDFELWLLWTVSEYVLATKDKSILHESVRPYPYKCEVQEEQTVLALLTRCYIHFINHTGKGEHSLPRLLGGDWNDNIVVGSITQEQHERIHAEGESVLVGAMASAVLARYGEMLDFAGEDGNEPRDYARIQQQAVREQWNGKWFKRAWLGGELGWVGDDLLWLEPQPWAIIGGAAGHDEQKVLVQNIKALVQEPSPIGAMITNVCPPQMKLPPGTVTNGGIWPSINGTLILALGNVDLTAAYEEWRKNTLACHAEQYPKSWEGIWSGPDTYNSVLAANPGRTHFEPDGEKRAKSLNWTDYPVYNLHPHAWTLYNAACMFAEAFTMEGMTYRLNFPEEAYAFTSPLFGLSRSEKGFAGHYAPKTAGKWTIILNGIDTNRNALLMVNAKKVDFERISGGGITFVGESSTDHNLTWSLVFE